MERVAQPVASPPQNERPKHTTVQNGTRSVVQAQRVRAYGVPVRGEPVRCTVQPATPAQQ